MEGPFWQTVQALIQLLHQRFVLLDLGLEGVNLHFLLDDFIEQLLGVLEGVLLTKALNDNGFGQLRQFLFHFGDAAVEILGLEGIGFPALVHHLLHFLGFHVGDTFAQGHHHGIVGVDDVFHQLFLVLAELALHIAQPGLGHL